MCGGRLRSSSLEGIHISCTPSRQKRLCFLLGPGRMASCRRTSVSLSQEFYRYCLPWAAIDGVLRELETEATTDSQRQLCCSYIRSNWVESSVWPPANWSVFQRRIRSNNDVESWHRRLNMKDARGQLNLYLLVLLASGVSLVDYQVQLMKESTILRHQRRDSKSSVRDLGASRGRETEPAPDAPCCACPCDG